MTVRRFAVLLEWEPDEQVWVSYVPALNHLSTYADTREEALAQTKEAITGYLEAAAKEGIRVPSNDPQAELVQLEVAVKAPGFAAHQRQTGAGRTLTQRVF